MSTEPVTLRAHLSAAPDIALPIDDVLHQALPLLGEVAQLHARGRVAQLGADDVLVHPDGTLHLRDAEGRAPRIDDALLQKLQPRISSALSVVGETRVVTDADTGTQVADDQVQRDLDQAVTRPVYLPDFRSWEREAGHHDEVTDVFLLGQILAALALGLDFDNADDVATFAANRDNLFALHPRLNPVLARVLVEATALNRHERASDLPSLIRRLETYRDQPTSLDVKRVLAGTQGIAPRRTALLQHLRDRLFDLSRRNRLLHFRATQASVNLTVASVPLVMSVQSIKEDALCTWGGAFAKDVLSGKPVALQRWLRFEDHPYLPGSLDRIVQDTRRDRAEYGASHLRLVVAFLRWNNLKDAPDDRIVSPLLWLPAELVKKKGVRDQYTLQCNDSEAEFNPALRHYLRQLYGIRLPETIDLSEVSLQAIHADLAAQIHATEPGIALRLQDRPAIELIHEKAVQHLRQFNKRRRIAHVRQGSARPDFSYDPDDYRPLGLALFRQLVQPAPLPLQDAVGAVRPRAMPMAPDSTVSSERYALAADRGHKFDWELDLTQVTLANFNYRKMSLVRDYAQLLEQDVPNPAFDRIFPIQPREVDTGTPAPLPLREQWNVVGADGTQNAAVSLARSGRSFIIQGPPGTGKSQTITNLIADFAAQGKRVLFVCEKRAALDVVFHRLKQSGLQQLCCLIHDSQADKKAFVADLKQAYEAWVAGADERDVALARRSASLDAMARELARVEEFEQAMAALPASLSDTVRTLVRRAIAAPAPPDIGAAARERLPDEATWSRHRVLATQLFTAMRERFGAASLAAHPFARLSAQAVTGDRVYGTLEERLAACEALLDRLDALDDPSLLPSGTSLADARAIAASARALVQAGLAAHPAWLDANSDASRTLQARRAEWDRAAAVARETADGAQGWRERLPEADARAAAAILRAAEPSFLRFLQPAWWRTRGEVRRRYDFSRHAVAPREGVVVDALLRDYEAQAVITTLARAIGADYALPDVAAAFATLEAERAAATTSPALSALHARLRDASTPDVLATRIAGAHEDLQALATHTDAMLSDAGGLSLAHLAELVRDLREHLDDLPDLVPLLQSMHAAGEPFAFALQRIALPEAHLDALIVHEALARLSRTTPVLARFDHRALSEATQRLAYLERELLGQDSAAILATLHRRFLDHVRVSAQSATQLDEAGKAFKKAYATGRRELEHEFGKSMRYRSIRDLADDETGLVLRDLKPIWLMSPLSVSDTLPLSTDLFDVVIFDEASQIPTEEAVPAFSRAPQVIVVGDEMQLPPTNFFSATGDDEDAIEAEEGGEKIAISLDADSLLNQAARNLPATLLAWHYRSRSDALISFSNAAFYEGRLITVPDRRFRAQDDGTLAGLREADDAAVRGVDGLLGRPVSFHKVDGVYADRTNAAEADYIAGLVRELLQREAGLSLGVVAFSEAQQTQIEAALEALAARDPDFAARLEREYVREDEDQFNGLFVKNLENVQGDERDIILLSICYAPGADGRMLMNFGPINQRGGEKRLNVIFSRARHHMAVVSSIGGDAITNVHNDGANALKAFLHFAQASSGADDTRAQSVLGALNPSAQQVFGARVPADAFRAALAEALRARGHVVHEHVGRSKFRCDLGIVDPSGDGYALGLLLDAGDAPADARERFVFRPSVLRAFGWRVIDVLSLDWLRDPQRALDRIEAHLAGRDDAPATLDVAPVIEVPVPLVATPVAADATQWRTFVFQEGASHKFWRIARNGGEVLVNYGRVGTQGQAMNKQFDDETRARREVEKLVAEKVRKGYMEQDAG